MGESLGEGPAWGRVEPGGGESQGEGRSRIQVIRGEGLNGEIQFSKDEWKSYKEAYYYLPT